ncbi:MAG: nucleotidyltransferase domain-containing protein [Candidatus Riflebacteria bacterium]|nr:nucleotidyltransferase domain-containing protein [Candidatus Riflebacteria bacterium]
MNQAGRSGPSATDGLADVRIIVEAVHGSRAYGLATAESDADTKGIFVPPPEWLQGFRPSPDQLQESPERVLLEVRKFFRLAVESNPTVLEILFTEPSDRLTVTTEGQLLIDRRSSFLSRRAGESFGGYGLSQLRRIKTHRRWLLSPPTGKPERKRFGLPERTLIPKDQLGAAETMLRDGRIDEAELTPNFLEIMDRERHYRTALREWQQYQEWLKNRNPKRALLERQFGYDTKHAMHLIRLLKMGVEVLTTGELTVRRPDREELLAIRRGELAFDQLMEEAERLGERLKLATAASVLPDHPDEEALDRLCIEIVQGARRASPWGDRGAR